MISMLAAGALMLASTNTKPVAAPPPPLTFEEKAGCGVGMTILGQVITKVPGAMDSADPEIVPMLKMMLRVMDEQGRVLLAQAFAEGAARQMTPSQVYQTGLDDAFKAFGDGQVTSAEQAGELMMKRFMGRCVS